MTLTVGGPQLRLPDHNGFWIQIDSEQLPVTAGAGTTTWTVTRVNKGTQTAAPHAPAINSPVVPSVPNFYGATATTRRCRT